MARAATVADDGAVRVTVALTTAGCPLRAQIQRTSRAGSRACPGSPRSTHRLDRDDRRAEGRGDGQGPLERPGLGRPDTRCPTGARVLAIASGKGGVGKSSVTVNLAAALAQRGFAVGVIDADIWGFSIPRMLGVEGRLAAEATDDGGRRIQPHSSARRRRAASTSCRWACSSTTRTDALMWRGLMLNRAVQHFLEDVAWADDLDYLLIDMPPGTGDVQMGLARMLPQSRDDRRHDPGR